MGAFPSILQIKRQKYWYQTKTKSRRIRHHTTDFIFCKKKRSRRVSSDHSTKLGLKVPTQSTTTHQGHQLQATRSSLFNTFSDCFWQGREILLRNVGPKPALIFAEEESCFHLQHSGFGLWILELAATTEHKCIIVIQLKLKPVPIYRLMDL